MKLDAPGIAGFRFERIMTRGIRRAAGMRESSATSNEPGLHCARADRVAELRARMGAAEPMAEELREAVRPVLAARIGREGQA
ncbi:MAG: hypothetical protein OEM24_03085 [Paracoccaceae bacterium]|nr:hypothetical protein [Paracoccaceae bacterium]